MRHVLFLINLYNDVDHNAPVMRCLLQQGHRVSIICLTQFDIYGDLRIKTLIQYPNFCIFPFKLLPRNSGLSNETTGSVHFFKKLFREIVFNKLSATIFLRLHSIETVVCTWGRPRAKGFQRQLFLASQILGIPAICLPHGQNIYTNYDVNTYLTDFYAGAGTWPDFSDRNDFSLYVVQTERHKKQLIDWGMDDQKVAAWGSMRFFPEWISENSSLYPPLPDWSVGNSGNIVRIVFFIPHWRYHVDKENTLNLIHAILKHPQHLLIVKGHTRGDSIDNATEKELESYPNLQLNSPHESTQLIAWSDVSINFGSSITYESIVRRKPVIYPSFLHTNQTVFDHTNCVLQANSIDHVLTYLLNIKNKSVSMPDASSRSLFLRSEIFADRDPFNVPQFYAKMLTNATN